MTNEELALTISIAFILLLLIPILTGLWMDKKE
jgi:hypothetical protein